MDKLKALGAILVSVVKVIASFKDIITLYADPNVKQHMNLVANNLKEDKIEECLVATAIRKHRAEDMNDYKEARKQRNHFDKLLVKLVQT